MRRVSSASKAGACCRDRHAFLLLDAPGSWTDPAAGRPKADRTRIDDFRGQVVPENSAVFCPDIRYRQGRTTTTMGPAGAVAGLFARTDARRYGIRGESGDPLPNFHAWGDGSIRRQVTSPEQLNEKWRRMECFLQSVL